jgi:hypothetical protein
MTDASLVMSFALTEKQEFNLGASLAKADYYVIDRADDYTNYRIGYSYAVFKNLILSADLNQALRDSNISGENYEINQVFLRVKATI